MRKTYFILLCLFVSIVAVSCVSAADMNDSGVTYLSDSDGYLDVEDAVSMSSSVNVDIKRSVVEIPRAYESKILEGCDESNDEIDSFSVETGVTLKNDSSSVESNDAVRKAPSSSDGIGIELKNGTFSVDVGVLPKDGTFKYLQSLVDIAKDGSTLYLHSDYYGGKNSKVTVNNNLTIDGQGHTIDCKNADKCFAFYSTKGNIVLKNLHIINGHNNDLKKGGAIFIGGSASYTLINCNLTDNWAEDYGGAIYNDPSKPLVIINCFFGYNNVSDDSGGAIYSKGKLYVENSTFDYNIANVDGGGIFCENDVNVTRCMFKFNRADFAFTPQSYGGAIRSKETVWIYNSTFDLNRAEDYGGAVYAKNIYVIQSFDPIQNLTTVSHFYNNFARDNDGGALYAENYTRLSYAEFENNTAYEDGGAICCKNIMLDNCCFKNNTASGAIISNCEGGAIFAKDDVVLLANNTFSHNVAKHGGAISADTTHFHEPSNDFYFNYITKDTKSNSGTCDYKGIHFKIDKDIDGKYDFKF